MKDVVVAAVAISGNGIGLRDFNSCTHTNPERSGFIQVQKVNTSLRIKFSQRGTETFVYTECQ